MPTKKRTQKPKNEVSLIGDTFLNGSFDDVFNMDEKEKSKQVTFVQKKQGKKLQLMAKINDLSSRLIKAESRFNLSLTDPTIDSVDVAVEMDCLKKERLIAGEIFARLFLDHKLMM
jgi:hypothetical protein